MAPTLDVPVLFFLVESYKQNFPLQESFKEFFLLERILLQAGLYVRVGYLSCLTGHSLVMMILNT